MCLFSLDIKRQSKGYIISNKQWANFLPGELFFTFLLLNLFLVKCENQDVEIQMLNHLGINILPDEGKIFLGFT